MPDFKFWKNPVRFILKSFLIKTKQESSTGRASRETCGTFLFWFKNDFNIKLIDQNIEAPGLKWTFLQYSVSVGFLFKTIAEREQKVPQVSGDPSCPGTPHFLGPTPRGRARDPEHIWRHLEKNYSIIGILWPLDCALVIAGCIIIWKLLDCVIIIMISQLCASHSDL